MRSERITESGDHLDQGMFPARPFPYSLVAEKEDFLIERDVDHLQSEEGG